MQKEDLNFQNREENLVTKKFFNVSTEVKTFTIFEKNVSSLFCHPLYDAKLSLEKKKKKKKLKHETKSIGRMIFRYEVEAI